MNLEGLQVKANTLNAYMYMKNDTLIVLTPEPVSNDDRYDIYRFADTNKIQFTVGPKFETKEAIVILIAQIVSDGLIEVHINELPNRGLEIAGSPALYERVGEIWDDLCKILSMDGYYKHWHFGSRDYNVPAEPEFKIPDTINELLGDDNA